MDTAGEEISKLEDKAIETIQLKHTEDKKQKINKQSLRIVWKNVRQSNIYAVEVPREERKTGEEKYLKK